MPRTAARYQCHFARSKRLATHIHRFVVEYDQVAMRGCKSRQTFGVGHFGSVASMGPRSDERGNLDERFLVAELDVLQWGRALMSAEIFWPTRKGR